MSRNVWMRIPRPAIKAKILDIAAVIPLQNQAHKCMSCAYCCIIGVCFKLLILSAFLSKF